ncbi:MAG: lamin tail domain-containing protein [Kofleriaceae bacterium]
MTIRWGCLAMVAACGGGAAPEIHDLADQVATVGQQLTLTIDGTDADGDQLTYGVHADISLQGNAMLTQSPSGAGVFLWTPLASDLGVHAFDFTASDGSSTTTVSISIDVRSTSGALPIFREPLGAGSVVNVAQQPCVMLNIVVEDQDTVDVTIGQEAPEITGATLTQTDGTTATWEWCPTPAQVSEQDRYTLVLSADDGENPKTIKNYVLALRSAAPRIVINEVDYDQVGTDTAEFIELYNPGGGAVSLAGLQVVLVNGATGAVYDTIDLAPAGSLAPDRYLVIAGPSVSVPGGVKLDPVWSQDQIQNGAPDAIALIDPVTRTVIDALSYEGSVTAATIADFPAAVSLVEGIALDPGVADSSSATRSLCRSPNGADTNNAATDWTACATLTPGAANVP